MTVLLCSLLFGFKGHELTHDLEDNWVPIIERDVDGTRSLPQRIDTTNAATIGRNFACRRVARTIYLGSAPLAKSLHRGLTEQQIKLGCVLPGDNVATFGDALRRLSEQAHHLNQDGQRYWYSTQPTVTRLVNDRASQYVQMRSFGVVLSNLFCVVKSQFPSRGVEEIRHEARPKVRRRMISFTPLLIQASRIGFASSPTHP